MIISFAWTTTALLFGRKTRTRREWDDDYAARFRLGDTHDAYDRSPRIGGHKIGEVMISGRPFKQNTSEMVEQDFEWEGLGWMHEQGLLIRGIEPMAFFNQWKAQGRTLWVIDFQLVHVTNEGVNLRLAHRGKL